MANLAAMMLHAAIVVAIGTTLVRSATIDKISPQSGSLGGSTLLTVYGTGFSPDQFTFGDGNDHRANHVTLRDAGGGEVQCETHVDGSTETMVQCHTPSTMQENVPYWVGLSVDGVAVSDAGYPDGNPHHDLVKFTATSHYTPTITSVTPTSGPPGTEITIKGRIVTPRYGSSTDISPNGREEMILRVYATTLCDPLDGDTLKINLDSESSYFGTISCIASGSYVGNSMVSFLVQSPFGRNKAAPSALRSGIDDSSYMFQFYTDVQSVWPRTSSINGGGVLTVTGDYYETGGEGALSTYSPARVYVGGSECEIIQVVKDGDITCTIPAMPPPPPDGRYSGNRGVTVESWDGYTFTAYGSLLDLTTQASNTFHFDDAKYCASAVAGSVPINKPTRLISRYSAPHDGRFAFFLKAHGAALYVDGVRWALSTSGYWSSDGEITLVRNQQYRVVVVAQGMAASRCVETKVLYYDTPLINRQSATVTQETQTIQLRSEQLPESLMLSVSPSTIQSATREVQSVCVLGTGDYITVSLSGVSTEPSAVDAESFKAVLDRLPVLTAGEDFDVQFNEGNNCFTVTFNSNRGDFAEFEDNDDINTITVTEVTAGIPDDTSFSFKVGDVISPPLQLAGLTDGHVHTAIDIMVGVQCPARFTKGGAINEGFERGAAFFGPMAVKDRESFCGRYSAKSPPSLYPIGNIETDLLLYFSPVMCFAYAGEISSMKVDYTDTDQVYRGGVNIATDTFDDITTLDEDSEEFLWRYVCINFFDELNDGQLGSLILHQARLVSPGTFWVDDLYFGVKSTLNGINNLDEFDVTSLRYGPAVFNPNSPFLVDDHVLSGCDTPLTQCRLDITPFECGHDFNTFEIFGNSENVVSVVPIQAASLPLTGTYTLSWSNGRPNPRSTVMTSSLNPVIDVEDDDAAITALLEQIPGIGNVEVSRSATSDCANADIWVTFLDQPGNQPPMQVTSGLVAPITRSVAILPHTDGNQKYEPIPGDMMFTELSKPQVVVFINDVPTVCAEGADCSFEWTDASTPKVTDISPTQGNLGVGDGLLTITGEKFSATVGNNDVTIAGIDCVVQTATPTRITCLLGNGPVGEYDVIVNVIGLGKSSYTAVDKFRYTADLTSMAPLQGGIAGQNILTLQGFGFSEACSVEFYKPATGAVQCDVIAPPTPTTIQCRIPIADLTSSVDITKPVRVAYSPGTYLPTSLQYTYIAGNAATILTITPTTLSVKRGQALVIVGNNLGTSGSLTIDGLALTIAAHSPTQVTATVPAPGLPPKEGAELLLVVDNQGAAVLPGVGIPRIDVKLEVTGIKPHSGSQLGGTKLSIAGAGFGTDTDAITVTVGNHACALDGSPTDTRITCTIANTSAVHTVTNEGTHPVYGIYYAFDPKTLTVQVGDYVHWKWITPDFVKGVGHGIRETVSGTDKTLLSGGIYNGPAMANGEYVWQFNKAKTHHIWSGYVDATDTMNYRGTITAVDRVDTAGEVKVTVDGHPAIHIVTENSECHQPDVPDRYRGHVHTTVGGRTCQRWDATSPQEPADKYTLDENFVADDSVADASNYCRSFVSVDGYDALWCYTTHPKTRWDNCDVPVCPDPVPGPPEACSYNTSGITAGCRYPAPDNDDVFNFVFSSCYTPTVTELQLSTFSRLSPENPEDSWKFWLHIEGSGFGTDPCAVKVKIGSATCTCDIFGDVLPSAFNCMLVDECSDVLDMYKYYPVSLTVFNYGASFQDLEGISSRSVVLEPVVMNVTPDSGSKGGGTRVTIDGSGLNGITSVTLNDVSARYLEIVNPRQLTFTTPPMNTDAPVTVAVRQGDGTAVCDPEVTLTGTPCKFTFSADSTPEITSVDPGAISTTGDVLLVITGSKFGADPTRLSVLIGDDGQIPCDNVAITSPTEVTCSISGGIPAGQNDVELTVAGMGVAVTPPAPLTGTPVITLVTPDVGSVHGGTWVTVSGHGFNGDTTVAIGSGECEVVPGSVSLGELTCVAPANYVGVYDVAVVSNGVTFPVRTFEYSETATPIVSDVTPTSGVSGNTVIITGSNLGTDPSLVTVMFGSTECDVTLASGSELQCTVGAHRKGNFPVLVDVDDLGKSDVNATFTYTLRADSVDPTSGDTRGGQLLTVSGAGFTDEVGVTVCGQPCQYYDHTDTTLACLTPSGDAASSPCDVIVQTEGVSDITLTSAYTYVVGAAASIDSIAPVRGGTAGGTLVVIAGSAFGSGASGLTIDIDGSPCITEERNDTEIQCRTSAHSGTSRAVIVVTIDGVRASMAAGAPGTDQFLYVDAWSSVSTWGGGPVPAAGELVVIPPGETILLDEDTPILDMLLIQGSLIFDDKDIELNAKIILIANGGLLQVGESEARPFGGRAVITLHGHHRSPEFPIYGNKVLGVREGTLELHGRPIMNPWTRLDETATAGDSVVTLQDDVSDWLVGDEVVIATTSHRHSQAENEKRTIASVSGRVVTFTEPLQYTHTGVDEQYTGPGGAGDERTVQFRAEAGLLSRNVVVRGNDDDQWHKVIEKCEAGFDTGQFVTQTCFLGRFGQEMGSSQFGAHILIHSLEKDTQKAQAHLSFVEVTFAGQAFRLGRYPIHFHILGNSDQSYVKGCSIHKTFNRAINIHGTHNILVERNVGYDIMGGAFFLEDGVETGNMFNHNLLVFVRSSSSLLNDDVTPAAYWVTNAYNMYVGNAAAGGTHFGYWFRMRKIPDGPHADTGVCPQNVPMLLFKQNSAHSFGRFGLWVFPELQPQVGGACGNVMDRVEPALFESLTVWNCEKGAEFVNAGALQMTDGVFAQNKLAGFEAKMTMAVRKRDRTNGCVLSNSLIVGRATSESLQQPDVQGTTRSGVVMPFGEGFQIYNTKIMDIDLPDTRGLMWTSIQGTCTENCNGYNTQTEKMQFSNVLYRGMFRWGQEGVLEDLDGSMCDTGTPQKITPRFGSAISNSCPDTCGAFFDSTNVDAAMCSYDKVFHRLALNNISPQSLKGKSLVITKANGDTTSAPYKDKRLSHKPGWMVILEDQETYIFEWENAELMTNVSFHARFSEFPDNTSCVTGRLKALTKPDRFSVDGGRTPIAQTTDRPINCSDDTIRNGDWQYDSDGYVTFAVKGPGPAARKKRAMTRHSDDIDYAITFYNCYFEDCIPPPDPNTIPPVTSRPENHTYWHTAYWTFNSDINVWEGTHVAPEGGASSPILLPPADTDVTIVKDAWIVVGVDTELPATLGVLRLEGVLEFDFNVSVDVAYSLGVQFVIIVGGRFVAGWPEHPLPCALTLTLLGSNDSAPYELSHTGPESVIVGFQLGTKAMGVYGGLDMFGKDFGPTWALLAVTGDVGATTMTVAGDVSGWPTQGTLVATSTNSNPDNTETVALTSAIYNPVTGRTTLSVAQPLAYKHVVSDTPAGAGTQHFAGAVGLMSRLITVRGEYHAGDYTGGRILVSVTQTRHAGGGVQMHTGYARISNVAFENMGQDGFTEAYDPRFAVTVLGTGAVSEAKPTVIEKSSFSNLHNGAIGAFGVSGLSIRNNVVHKALGDTIVTRSVNTNIQDNLVAETQWTGVYGGRNEPENIRYEAGIEAIGAIGLTLNGNYIAGSQRVGYHVPGEDCAVGVSKYGTISENWAVGNLMGVATFPDDDLIGKECSRFQGFRLWANLDYGLYFNNINSATVTQTVFADNKVSFFPMVVGPSSLLHNCKEKKVTLRDSTLIGHTTDRDCSSAPALNDPYLDLCKHCRGVSGPNGEGIGLVFGQFTQSGNQAPKKPCAGIKAYNSLCGETSVTGVTFAHFGPHASCGASIAIASSESNEDLQHPMTVSANTIVPSQIDADHILAYHRPVVTKINPADCVDMDCDAKKKLVLQDVDGTTLGYSGAAIAESEWQWDVDELDVPVDARRGLGDYRVPNAMITKTDGTIMPYTKLRDHQGILHPDCYKTTGKNFALWNCPGLTYRMMVIESLDDDTETRRLSPVAVLSERYLDLINGPQDHGWCAGYTCQKRLSTFHAVVAPGRAVTVYLSSTIPDKTRFFLLNAADDECILVSFYYEKPQRIDVYIDSGAKYVEPTNGVMTDIGTPQERFVLQSDLSPVQYLPNCSSTVPKWSSAGANYIDLEHKLVKFLLRGDNRVVLKGKSVVLVTIGMPSMTEAEFFASDMIIVNFAAILGVPLSKVRVVKVVAAGGRRRRRATGITVIVEAASGPTDTAFQTDDEDLLTVTSLMMDSCQAGSMSSYLGSGADTVCDSIVVGDTEYNPSVPTTLVFVGEIAAGQELAPFPTQPVIQTLDQYGVVIPHLGIVETPWQMTATLRDGRGHVDARLIGTVTVTSTDGVFSFTNLGLSHQGGDYIVDFIISGPPTAAALGLTLASGVFSVDPVALTAGVHAMTSGDIVQNHTFTLTLELRDSATDTVIEDIAWRGHTFDVTCGLPLPLTDGNLTGTLATSYDVTTGYAQYDDLMLSGYGPIYIECTVVSAPAEYDFKFYQLMIVVGEHQVDIVREKVSNIQLRFPHAFSTTLPTAADRAMLHQTVAQDFVQNNPNVIVTRSEILEGSILILITIEGAAGNVTTSLLTTCDSVSGGKSYTVGDQTFTLDKYMTVDGQGYYGVDCGASESGGELHPGYIALIAVLGVLLLAACVLLLLWKVKVIPRTKTHATPVTQKVRVESRQGGFYYIDNGKTVYLPGLAVKTEDIFFNKKNARPTSAAPEATLYSYNKGGNAPGMRSSPDPLYSDGTLTARNIHLKPRAPQRHAHV